MGTQWWAHHERPIAAQVRPRSLVTNPLPRHWGRVSQNRRLPSVPTTAGNAQRSPECFGAGYALLAKWTATDIESLSHGVKNAALALTFAAMREHEPCQARQAAR